MRTIYKIKRRLGLLALCMFSGYAFSQSISGYGFSALTGTFTPITGGTSTSNGATDDDAMSNAFPIGFTFAYGGVDFTQVQASSNGTLLFGTGKTQSATNNLSTATATQRPGVAPLWDDLQATEGIKYLLQGSAPNRTLTVQWLNMEWNYQSNTAAISFQVILKETSNIIDVIYRQDATAYSPGTTGGASIGIMGLAAADFISLQDAGAAPVISSTTSANGLTTKPATGQIYRFTPPNCPQPTSVTLTTATAFTATIDWNAGNAETDWTIEYGPTGFTQGTGTFMDVTGTSAGTITGLSANTAYQAYVTAICAPTDSSVNSLPVSFTTLPTCPQPTAVVLNSATTSTAMIDWTPGGSETAWTIEYGPAGFTAGTGTFVDVAGTSAATLSGLTPSSFYQAYITAICSPTDSSANSTVVNFNTYGIAQYMEAGTDCAPAGFTDISTTGTVYTLGDDDETGFTLPFNFYYQGTIVTTMTIGNNGAVFFGGLTQQVGFTNTAIGAGSVTGLYPFWDDLGTAGAGVYSQVIGTAPNRQAIIQWNKTHLSVGGPDLIFQVILDEATSEIYYNYDNTIVGNAGYDNAAAATIGIAGPNQDIQVSFNSPSYLEDNSCAHFYYTDCPKPTNLTFSNITADEFSADWSTGLSGETSWTVEYGEQGFTVGTGTILTDITTSQIQIPNLDPITTYDVYVYASCSSTDSSAALTGSVQTLPLCADPYGLSATAHRDSIFSSWLWTQTVSSLTGFNLQYVPNGSGLYSANATIVPAAGMNYADTIADTDLMAGVTYQLYVQSVCGTDTSNFVGPVSITMPLTNDTVCYAEQLMTDGTVYTFTNAGATVNNTVVANQEQTIAPPNTGLQTTTGWGNSTISFSTWFTFTAPASGQVRISGKNVGFDGQMAVYEVGDCAQFSTFTLKAANDNEIGGSSAAPNFTVCGLTPGNTYYLMHDSYSTFTTGTYSIKITGITLDAGSTASLLEICTGDSVNLYEGITGFDDGGVWSPIISSIDLVQDSLFASEGLAYQTFQFQYRLTDGCAYDSILANVKVFPPSHAGTDGSLVICRNEPFNLVEGLDGTIDLNGTWYDPNSVVVPDGSTTGNNMPGQYNFKYVVGNGVCPNDTSKVIVSVQNSCNYLGLDEAVFEGFNLYPNPTEGSVYISNSGSSDVFSYEVLDLNGRKVMTKENAINGTTVTEIDLNAVETGIYMIHVYNGNAEKTFRVVVK